MKYTLRQPCPECPFRRDIPVAYWNGRIAEMEMYRTFNCGIGMCVVVSADDADRAIDVLASAGETARVIGHIREGERTVEIS